MEQAARILSGQKEGVGWSACMRSKRLSSSPTMSAKNIPPPFKCFVTVAAATSISPVMKSLETRGIQLVWSDRFDWSTSLGPMKELIKESDFVCAFSPGVLSTNVIFEIGIAIGMGKPIFLVTGEGLSLPADLRSMSFIKANQWDDAILQPHLDAFLKTLPKKSRQTSQKKRSTQLRLDFSHERKQLDRFANERTPREFESFVEDLFRKAGMNVTTSPIEDYGADFAVVSPEIKRRFGNAILVEVKYGPLRPDMAFVVNKLAELVERGRGSTGLVVTFDALSPRWSALRSNVPTDLPIYALSVNELIDRLESGALVDSIWAEKNRTLEHGV